MTPDDLAAIARALYGEGHGAISSLANELDVAPDTMRRVLNGRAPMPDGWARDALALVERRTAELGALVERVRRSAP